MSEDESNSNCSSSSSSSSGSEESTSKYWKVVIRKKPKIYGKQYLKGSKLGTGSFAKVNEVLDMRTLHRRAVKRINLSEISKKQNGHLMVNMINVEAKLLRSLDHKHIIKVVDIIRKRSEVLKSNEKIITKNKMYVFMEYCVSSVEEIIDASPTKKLPKGQAQRYFLSLLEAIDYLHSRGVVHKDIKPANMLISDNGTVKVADLGVCDVIDQFASNDIVMKTFGTKLFQSPEIYACDDGFSAYPVDIWAAGVTLFMMVTGEYPFYNEDLYLLSESIQNDAYKTTSELLEDNLLHNLIDRMLIKDPKERIKINDIRRQPWLLIRFIGQEVEIPPRQFGDNYRSMTITPYLHQYHSPLKPSENIALASESTTDIVNRKLQVPIIRSNRYPESLRDQQVEMTDRRLFIILGIKREKRSKRKRDRNANKHFLQ